MAPIIPIFALLGASLVVSLAMILKHRQQGRISTERLRAMELGIPVSLPPDDSPSFGQRRGYLIAGILCLSLAFAFGILSAFSIAVPPENAKSYFTPAILLGSLGIGSVVIHALRPKVNGQVGKSPASDSSKSIFPPNLRGD